MEAQKLANLGAQKSILNEAYTSALTNKWGELLEGLPSKSRQDRYMRHVMAMLFENTARNGSVERNAKGLLESTLSGDIAGYDKVIFPLLRLVFPNLIAPEIVSVQPMNGPTGRVFYMDYTKGTTKAPSVSGQTFPSSSTFDDDYTSEFINGELVGTGDGAKWGGMGTALAHTLGFKPVRPLDSDSPYDVQVDIKELNATTGAEVQVAVDDGAGGFTGDTTAGAINYTTGAITAFLFTNPPATGNPVKVFYWYNGELNSQIPEMQLDVTSSPVEAKARRLKAVWSPEAAEDLAAQHGADAEAEIVAAAAQEISLEIDREIIQTLYANSTGSSASFNRTVPSGITELDHLRSIVTQISSVSSQIHKKTLRAPANFIVTSSEVSALLEQLTTHGDFRQIWSADQSTPYGSVESIKSLGRPGQFGIYKAGTLQNKWTVFVDPLFQRDRMLIGLNGDGYLNAGFVYAPYIPLQVTVTLMNPDDISLKKALRTRYATKMLRSNFYGQLIINNL